MAPSAPATDDPGTLGGTGTIVWIVAVLAAVAGLVSLGLEPALPGVWVGINHVIHGVKLGAALLSQLLAVFATLVVFLLVAATLRSTLPAYLRAFAVGAAVLVVLAVLVACVVRLPHVSRLMVAASTSVLALLCVRLSARFINLRAASLVVAAMAMAGMLRVLSIAAAQLVTANPSEALLAAARSVATGASLLEAIGVVAALAWLVVRPGGPRAPRIAVVSVVVVAAAAALYAVVLGDDPEAAGMALLLARAVRKMLLAPAPYTPELVRMFVELLAWLTALAALATSTTTRLMGAAVALALVARGHLEVPLCAIALVIAALALVHHPGPDLRREIDLLQRKREQLSKVREEPSST